MASSYNTVPTEDAPKKKPWKGAVASVAAASFMLGVLAVTAVRTTLAARPTVALQRREPPDKVLVTGAQAESSYLS
jgi:hypothetical protein